MALYRYVKAPPKQNRKPQTVASAVLMVGGFGLLLWTVWPILSFSTFSENFLTKTISPIGTNGDIAFRGKPATLPEVVKAEENVDMKYSNVNSWFPGNTQKKVIAPVTTYTLSIPKLNIEDASVTVAGDDLSVSLVHYGGTPNPGTYGNTVIFGHSSLPQFYNPKNYKSIFSTLPTLKNGDVITISYDGVKFSYVVFDLIVVEPTDLTPLEQKFDDSYITLVTCVPPGTYWKRLNVKARLERSL